MTRTDWNELASDSFTRPTGPTCSPRPDDRRNRAAFLNSPAPPARREAALLRRLAGLPNVPRWSGHVRVNGRPLPHAVAHDFIPGHPLGDRERVRDDFFPTLRALLAAMHRRGVAYVDLHKRENILVGDDGQPYLIDFQIGLARPGWWPANHEAVEAVLRLAQANDVYHLAKHVARCRPDQ